MSLYSNIRDNLSSQTLLKKINGGLSQGLGSLSGSAVSSLGGGSLAKAVAGKLQGSAETAARGLVNRHMPASLRSVMDKGSGVMGSAFVGQALSGDYAGALEGAVDMGAGLVMSGGFLGGSRNVSSPIFGGGTLANMQEISERVLAGDHAHKNLFILEVQSMAPGEGDFSDLFNLFAVDVDYDPFNITGEKLRVGGASVDRVTGQEAVEMRLTTYDDVSGQLKYFWERHHAATSARDGTVGVPANYAIKVRVLHGVATGGNRVNSAYSNAGLFRVGSLTTSQSRRDVGITELQMTLSQIDTFMKA